MAAASEAVEVEDDWWWDIVDFIFHNEFKQHFPPPDRPFLLTAECQPALDVIAGEGQLDEEACAVRATVAEELRAYLRARIPEFSEHYPVALFGSSVNLLGTLDSDVDLTVVMHATGDLRAARRDLLLKIGKALKDSDGAYKNHEEIHAARVPIIKFTAAAAPHLSCDLSGKGVRRKKKVEREII
jgi:DNA polymerase sigma